MINDGNYSFNFTSFTSNQATHDGGALLIVNAGGSILDSNFTNNLNTQWNGGGALKLESSSPTIQNCVFSYNRTQGKPLWWCDQFRIIFSNYRELYFHQKQE